MTTPTPWIVLWLAGCVAASTAPSCGGKAVVDDMAPADGGPPSSSTSTSTSSTSTSGTPATPCGQVCALLDECLVGSDCLSGCNAVHPDCKGKQDLLLACVLEQVVPNYPCDLPDVCVVKLLQLADCTEHAQAGGTCTSDMSPECSCAVDDEQQNLLEMDCQSDGDLLDCACRQNGTLVGNCQQMGWSECNPYADCCAMLFFVPGL